MKAEIKKDGELAIIAETELEAFALGEWLAKSISDKSTENEMIITGKILFNWSLTDINK